MAQEGVWAVIRDRERQFVRENIATLSRYRARRFGPGCVLASARMGATVRWPPARWEEAPGGWAARELHSKTEEGSSWSSG